MAGTRFIAAAIPRTLRQHRLTYIQRQDILGTITAENKFARSAMYYDVVMFTPEAFERAKKLLSAPIMDQSAPDEPHDNPIFIPKIYASVDVPENAADPEQYARVHFMNHFSIYS